eukprot:790525-Pyramimonas_sp.AAC.1
MQPAQCNLRSATHAVPTNAGQSMQCARCCAILSRATLMALCYSMLCYGMLCYAALSVKL